ncbi:CDP-6-deoxy-delta-3,4-glucoseen reductase [Urechidicola sp. KH5]
MKNFTIKLRNDKSFKCSDDTSILQASIDAGLTLEHSCKSGRCRSCVVKLLKGKTLDMQDDLILSQEEKNQGKILSCITSPLTDLKLDIEEIGNTFFEKVRTLPVKIHKIEKLTLDVIKVTLRFPPKVEFGFSSGQYVNIIKGSIKRSYSIANFRRSDEKLEFYIKKYPNGLMSKYWFEEANENDLLRIEGPLGTFTMRDSNFENVIFLATGTGVAPIKSILEQLNEHSEKYKTKKILLIWGGRLKEDLFWLPEFKKLNFKFIPVLSQENIESNCKKVYVQDKLLKQKIALEEAQVYACGSIKMIESSRSLLLKNSLSEDQFYSDAFVSSN